MMERSALPPIWYMRNGLRKVSLIGADGEGMQRSEQQFKPVRPQRDIELICTKSSVRAGARLAEKEQ